MPWCWRSGESLPPGSLDVVVSLHTLEHLPQPRPTLEQLARRLVPGGVLLFVVPNPGGLGHRLKGRHWFAYRDPTHCSVLSRGEWLTLARRVGLQVLWVRGDGMWDPPYVPWMPLGVQRLLFGAPAGIQMVLPLRRPFLPDGVGGVPDRRRRAAGRPVPAAHGGEEDCRRGKLD